MTKSYMMSRSQFLRHYRTPQRLLDESRNTVFTPVLGKRQTERAEGLFNCEEVVVETIATYLNKRLAQIGVKYVFAIPGDYITEWVETLDCEKLNPGHLVRLHPNNEMVATYAADGYGRAANGTVGCVAFTYGVGSLNAVQAVAGAFVESVPLVVINGSPSVAQFNSQRDQGVLWHHMFDGSMTDLRVFQNVTAMAVRIDNPATAPELIDAALTTCITQSKPVYIEIANQTVRLPCRTVPSESLKPSPVPQDTDTLNESVKVVLERLQMARKLVLVGGVEVARAGLQEQLAELARTLDAPYVSSLLGKSVLSEYRDDVRFSGVYNGRNSQKNVQELMEAADCVLFIGVHETDFNFTGLEDASPEREPTTDMPLPLPRNQIEARMGAVQVRNSPHYWGDVRLAPFLSALPEAVKKLEGGKLPNAPFPGLAPNTTPWDVPTPDTYPGDAQVTWDSFKSYLAHNFIQKDSVLLADTGCTFYSLNNVKVDQDCFIAQLAWGAIGYTVGANEGVKLANDQTGNPQRRVISVCGDGAFAESLNEIGTLAQLGLNSVIFVMDNRVFAIEQWLIKPKAFCPDGKTNFDPLTDVPQGRIWDYVKIAEGFGGNGFAVRTNAQLANVLEELKANASEAKFSLVAVNIVDRDLPSNMKWKLNCGATDDSESC